MEKRIVFSTSTGNDQGFRIPNDVLDFTRYAKNPVLMKQHEWEGVPLGLMTAIDFANGEWTGIPVFHRKTPESIVYADLWEGGFLTACSIGGFKKLKTTGRMTRDKDGNQVPEIWTDDDGLAVCTSFEIYEISMVAIPSNMDAVQKQSFLKANADLNARCYDDINIKALEKELTTLSAKLNSMNVEEEAAKEAARVEEEKAKLAADKLKADALAAGKKADDLPAPINGAVKAEEAKKKAGLGSQVVEMFKAAVAALSGMGEDRPTENVLAAPPLKNLYTVEGSKTAEDRLFDKLPEKVGKMKAEKAEKLAEAKMEAQNLLADALEAKKKADSEDATEDDAAEFAAKKKKAEDAVKKAEELDAEMDDDDMSDEMKAKKQKEQLAAKKEQSKVTLKSMEELKADGVKLAAKPNLGNRVAFTSGTPRTMTQLLADPQGKRIVDRVKSGAEGLEPAELGVYLSAKRNEPKYKAVFDTARVILGANEQNYKSFRQNSRSNPGESVDQIAARLQSGNALWVDKRDGQVKERSTLNATDNFLASPDLFAMDFLDLAIFALFPTTSWKNDIPIFGAQSTENNAGLIWANIASDPTIYRGNQPVNPVAQQFNDTPVSLNLTPYWMNPVVWTPLTMAQLRYNQMDTQWAQNFAKMGTVIDDYLLYTLAAAVPHSSIVYSSGVSPNPTGGNTPVQTFTLNGNQDNPYGFYYNPLFAGTLFNPTLNDVLMPELIYNKQNFELQNERPVLVMDPTTYTLIKQTGQSQSLLTRWIDDNGKDQLGFSHTRFNQRSRVIAFNPQTAQVLSPTSIIPSVATSGNLGFIPSQVGIGIGNLDVFMIQSPTDYGYKASADVRMGIVPLRANNNGISLLVYGPEIVS